MKHLLKRFSAALALIIVVGFSQTSAFASPTYDGGIGTDQSASKTAACDALQQLDSTKACGKGTDGVGGLIRSVINILSIIVGIAAVIMIIISGLKYVTSGGDSGGISSAKTTLVYALVGLVVAALAQFLVHFVLQSVASSDCTANPTSSVCAAK